MKRLIAGLAIWGVGIVLSGVVAPTAPALLIPTYAMCFIGGWFTGTGLREYAIKRRHRS